MDVGSVVGTPGDGVWLAAAIAIMTMVCSPIFAQGADYWGRKWFLIIPTFLGCIGAIITALSTTMNTAILGQVIAGISYGAQPLNHAIPSEVLPRKYRPYAQAVVNVAACIGGFLALIAGGALTRNGHPEGFRPFWYIGAAIYGVSGVIGIFCYNPPLRALQTSLTQNEKLRLLDWPGYFLLIVGLVLTCVGLSWAENPYTWSDPHVLSTFTIGIVFCALLITYEWKFTKTGMFHHSLFKLGPNFAIALGTVFVEGMLFFCTNNYFAYQVSTMYETDRLIITTRYSLTFILFALFAITAGAYCSYFKIVRLPTSAAFLSFLIFFILMATSSPTTSGQVWGYPAFLGFGLGVCLCTLVTAAQLCTPPELISLASGLMIGVRSFGGSIGLAIYNAVFATTISRELVPRMEKAVVPLGIAASEIPKLIPALTRHNAKAVAAIPGMTHEIARVAERVFKDAHMVAFRWVWVAAGSFAFVALVASLFLQDPKREFNGKIDAPVEREEELYGRTRAREREELHVARVSSA